MEDPTDNNQQARAGEGPVNLLYTVAFDGPETGGMRQMVKMLGCSVVRTAFTGDMVIFRNAPQPVFLIGRQGIGEEYVETLPMDPPTLTNYARAWKAHAGEVFEAEAYEWVVFLDADCLCLRNIDHLLSDRDCEILYQPETGRRLEEGEFSGYITAWEMEKGLAGEERKPLPRWGVNSGTWAVRGECFKRVMEEWVLIQAEDPLRATPSREQSAWNRLILDAAEHGWRAEPFEAHEVQFPLGADQDWKLYKDAAIVHCAGGTVPEKIQFMFGLYMQRFFHDPSSTLLNIMEM